MSYIIAVMDANSVMGRDILHHLTSVKRPWISEIRAFGDSSAETAHCNGQELPIKPYSPDAFAGVDLAILGNEEHVDAGAVVVSSLVGATDSVTVIPNLNPEEIEEHRGIVAVPSGVTIALAHTLAAMGETTTHVSGTALLPVGTLGPLAIEELFAQTMALFNQNPLPDQVLGGQVAFNTRRAPTDWSKEAECLPCPASLISVMVPVFGGTTLTLDLTTTLTSAQAVERLAQYPFLNHIAAYVHFF